MPMTPRRRRPRPFRLLANARPLDRAFPPFGDRRPQPCIGFAPATYPVHGIDLSRWLVDIDWPTARAAGVSFTFIKATEGGDVADPLFPHHRATAAQAGDPGAAPHYDYFCRSPEEQARPPGRSTAR